LCKERGYPCKKGNRDIPAKKETGIMVLWWQLTGFEIITR
jgi:hypothetical protein